MDQIHHIRDMFYQQDKNISEIASETGLNWKTVKKYVDMEDFNSPPPIPASSEIHQFKLDPFKPLIDEWLQADKLAPRKQRHTAQRVCKRWVDSILSLCLGVIIPVIIGKIFSKCNFISRIVFGK